MSAGRAGKHAAARHHSAKSKLDETISSIEHMPRRLVHHELRSYGVDPEKAVKRLQLTVARLGREHHPLKPSIIPSERERRGVMGWHGTQFIADALRAAPMPEAGLTVIADGFRHLGTAADALLVHCADPDAVWPLAESIYEATIIVVTRPSLWGDFAAGHARLVSRLSGLHQCVLVHNMRQLAECNVAPPPFMTILARALSHGSISHEAHALLRPRSVSVRHSGDVVALLKTPIRDPLASFQAIESLGRAAASRVGSGRCVDTLLALLRDNAAAHFFAMAVLTRLHRSHPERAADVMAGIAESATEKARYALFVAVIKAYEHSFAGRRQYVVHQFDLRGAPRFIPGEPHDLDAFGTLVCRSRAARELHPQMDWANRRLAIWLSR